MNAKVGCRTSGGKGNIGHFIERDSRVCAAGVPSSQPTDSVAAVMQRYTLQDEVDALLSDAIHPKPAPPPLPPLRHPIPLDMRFAGLEGNVGSLINPPILTKFQQLVQDFKETSYESYWKKVVGQVPDPVPMLPEGMDVYKTTFGKKTPFHGRLYDIVMPPQPLPDKTPEKSWPGVQVMRCYFSPPFSKDFIYGSYAGSDKSGKAVKCALTYDKRVQGTDGRTVLHHIQADFQERNQAQDGLPAAPNNNVSNVPEGYSFGILKPPDSFIESVTFCNINPHLQNFKKCLAHLNTVRINLSKRFLPNFFGLMYRQLKYFDQEKTGWLPKKVVYDYCGTKLIRFDTKMIEQLLTMWNGFDGNKIEYRIFVDRMNYRIPLEDLPRVIDIGHDCLDFRTTYGEMVKPGQPIDERHTAGLPSVRIDVPYPITLKGCCRADRIHLMDECDVKSRLSPSVIQLLNVSHRDMYEKRDQCTVRRVFEAAGEKFTDEEFCNLWEEAAKQHPEGWVCYETFRNVLDVHLSRKK